MPQVVDALSPLPVVAAAASRTGAGLAAALLFGAAGANIGTRFLASVEASIGDDWKQRLVDTSVDGRASSPRPVVLDRRSGPRQPMDEASHPAGRGRHASVETAADIVLASSSPEQALARASRWWGDAPAGREGVSLRA